MPREQESELPQLQHRLVKLQDHLDKQAEIVADTRPLLAQESTWPRPRREVQEALRRALLFDVSMLLEEQVAAKRRIAELEQEILAAERTTATNESLTNGA